MAFVIFCWTIGLAFKGALGFLLQLVTKTVRFGNVATLIFSVACISVSMGTWFIPKLSGIKYTEDLNWSTLYLLSTGLDFLVF